MDKKTIDDIVWYIPFKKLRNALREYLLNISNNIENILALNNIYEILKDKKLGYKECANLTEDE